MEARSGTTTTMRVDRPDGTTTEIVWPDLGRTIITHRAEDGAPARRYDVALETSGEATVRSAVGDGAAEPIEPTSTTAASNPYGSTLEEHDYDGIVRVIHGFDDEGRFRSTSVEGAWGRQDLEVRPDLGRTLSWSCPLHHGKASWNAWERLDGYQVSFSDGSSFRWELVKDRGRETTVGWDGRTVIVEDAAPPTVGQGPR